MPTPVTDETWLQYHYPIDWETGIEEAWADAARGDAVDADVALTRSRQRFRTGMVRNAAYWAGYSSAAAAAAPVAG